MRWLLVLLAFVSCTLGHHHVEEQQAINQLLYRVAEPINSKFTDLKGATKNWNPRSHTAGCKDGGKAVEALMHEIEDGRVLEKHHWFSLFNTRQREEALMLVDVLLSCTDFDHFKYNAAYFREKMNEGEFVFALYAGVTHSDLTQDVVLPPLYEVTPHLFTNDEVIQKAYSAQMTQTPGKFRMEFTGSKKNPEQRVAYFGEDIGLNSHHVHWHLDFPFWWTGEKIDRKGELFFWLHHQLTARFDAERLSNHMSFVDELHWDDPIVEGFAPHATYKYGGQFPNRPDNRVFQDVDGVAKVREMKAYEHRIHNAIAHGYIVDENGHKISIDNENGIDILGTVIEASMCSPNLGFFGSLHNLGHIMLGRQGDPKGKYDLPPGVMEHFETATRDPSFFRLHKYIDNIFKEHKDTLPPYTKEELTYDNVEIFSVGYDGNVETYFEDFEFDLSMGLDSREDLPDVPVSAVVSRLSHKPFTFVINVNAKRAETVTVRIYLCPKHDYNGIEMIFDEARWGCIEMDKFWTQVHPGHNDIRRNAEDSSVAIPDRTSFADLIHDIDAAVTSGTTIPSENVRACGHPQRMLLPKGNKEGMDFELFVDITSGDDAVHSDLSTNEHGGTHGYCGIKGQKYPDKKPMGYPLDRHVEDPRNFKVPNIMWTTVKVRHVDH